MVIVVLAAVGLLPLIMETKALDATTVSGLVVMGLAPPVVLLLFTHGYRPLTFHLPFWWCARRLPHPVVFPALEFRHAAHGGRLDMVRTCEAACVCLPALV